MTAFWLSWFKNAKSGIETDWTVQLCLQLTAV